MSIAPLLKRASENGALCPVTEDFLAEVFFVSRTPKLSLANQLGLGPPWSKNSSSPADEPLTGWRSVSSRRLTVRAMSLCVAPRPDEPLEAAFASFIPDHSQQPIETSRGAS